MFLRLSISLLLVLSSSLTSQENDVAEPPKEKLSQADTWFAEADKVYEYAKLELNNKNVSTATRAFGACVPLFERFANTYPKHPDASKAIYRAGVADLLIGRRTAAESKFVSVLIKTKKKGQTAASAAFRLGALAYNDEHYKTALPQFKLTAKQA